MKRLLVFLAASFFLFACDKEVVETFLVTDLQVDYMTTPLGIDTQSPRFSWKMQSDAYDQHQASYRILVREAESGALVFDSGDCLSDVSVGVVYRGEQLKPCTRYDWTVEVTDAQQKVQQASSWFETGLMDSGWSGARWISGGQPHFSKYRTNFVLDYDVTLPAGSREAGFLFGWLDETHFVRVQLQRGGRNLALAIRHPADNGEVLDFQGFVSRVSGDANVEKRHHVQLRVVAMDYAKGYKIWPAVDGSLLVKEPVVVELFPGQEWQPYCRFNQVGFEQPAGTPATFSNLTVTERVWGTTLYASDAAYAIAGGERKLLSPAEESAAPMFRKSFEVKKKLVSARLYTTARGIYEYKINDVRLADDWFNPGSTDYRFRLLYNSYDITHLLKPGHNAVGAMLGAGWYSDFTGYATAWQDQYGTELSLMAKILLKYVDGTQEIIVSDGSWKVFNAGPITSDSFQNGEDYDARRECEGWSNAGSSDEGWVAVTVVNPPADEVELQYYIGSPIRNNITLHAVSVSEPRPGVFVYDIGQNMVGVPRIHLRGREGQEITFRYGEMIYPEEVPEDPLPPLTAEVYEARKGLVYNENYRGALATDHYICRGGRQEVFQPHFTFHGFRYIEIHGLDNALPLADVEGLVLESVGRQLSGFESSNADVNRLYENIVWGQRGNFLSIPTDCPQRDERLGWMGDAQVFVRAATYNMNVDPFFTRWFHSLRDSQAEDGSYPDFVPYVGIPPQGAPKGRGAMGWMEAGIIIPWQLYLQYGDSQFIREHYDSMAAYLDFLQHRAVNDIQPGSGYGDWVAIEHTNTPLTNTAYYAYDALLMSKMADAIGKYADAERYKALYERIKEAFNREFVGPDGITRESAHVPPYHEWIAGGADASFTANTQTSYVVPLQAELFDADHEMLAVENLVENVAAHGYRLTTGFIGTPYLNLVLSKHDFDEVAYQLFEQTDYPSWLYPVLQGATTMWERWNSYTIKRGFGPVDMNSFNHYSFGAIEEWMFSYMLGIQPVESDPGYHSFVLAPRPGGSFRYVRGHYDTVYGRIESSWRWLDNFEGMEYEFVIPANTTARVQIPVSPSVFCEVVQGGRHARETGESGVYLLPSGHYRFIVK